MTATKTTPPQTTTPHQQHHQQQQQCRQKATMSSVAARNTKEATTHTVKRARQPTFTAEHVSPALVVPTPVVSTDRGLSFAANRRNWLFPHPGSPAQEEVSVETHPETCVCHRNLGGTNGTPGTGGLSSRSYWVWSLGVRRATGDRSTKNIRRASVKHCPVSVF